MRLDKFLKVSRLIKRRTVANEACDAGRVLVNGAPARASLSVKKGDQLEITYTFDGSDIRIEDDPVYALVAPAFLGQFSPAVTPGRLRTAFRALGFTGMVEVALFADLLTLKEALEFHRHVRTDGDFQLTSCCCPVWIAMVRRVYRQLMPHVPGAVSPMVAAGRAVKALHPDALTIFVGPCLAKKSEAREPDLAGAVDFVLTFQEVRDIFRAADLRPEELAETDRDHSSRCGRLYARAGGVSEAVQATVERLCPDHAIPVRARRADGVPACRAMLEELLRGMGPAAE